MLKVLALFSFLATTHIAISSGTCDISGLDKVAVVKALWRVSMVAPAAQMFTPVLAAEKEITDREVQEALGHGYIDYLKCRLIKADFSGNSFSTRSYNCVNGEGAAEKIIASLRQ